jgi:hypothetical protein
VQVEKLEDVRPTGRLPESIPAIRRLRGRGFNSLRRESIRRRRQANAAMFASLVALLGLVGLFAILLR